MGVPGLKPRLAACKLSALPTILSGGSPQHSYQNNTEKENIPTIVEDILNLHSEKCTQEEESPDIRNGPIPTHEATIG